MTAPRDRHDGTRLTPRAWRWHLLWVGLGLLSVPTIAIVLGTEGWPSPSMTGWLAIVAATLGVVLADLRTVELPHGRGGGGESVSLVDTIVVALLVLFAPGWAWASVVAGSLVVQVVARRPVVKSVFNVAHFSAAMASAVLLVDLTRGSADPVSVRGLGSAFLGIIIFGVVSWVAVGGIIARIQQRSSSEVLAESEQVSVLGLFGNAGIGLMAAVLVDLHPGYLVLAIGPAAAMGWALFGHRESLALRHRVRGEQSRLERIVEGVSDGILMVGEDDQVEVWGPQVERLTGIAPADAAQRPVGDVFVANHVDGRPFDIRQVRAVATQTAPSVVSELEVTQPDGSHCIVSCQATVLYSAYNQQTAVVLLLHDVTRERETDRLKDDFLMRVTHELRTPLTPIKGFAQSLLLNMDKATPELIELALERISNRADHMTRLIDELLRVSTMSSGGRASTKLELVRSDLRNVIEDALARWRDDEPIRRFSVDGPPDLEAMVDQEAMRQILDVLLQNACLYSDATAPVRIVTELRDAAVVVSISDEGRGIPADHLDRVFDRFHRVENPLVMTTGGLGIGLFVARRLAEAMGGTLHAQSVLGQGSTFVLRLPHSPAPVRDGSAPTDTTPSSAGARLGDRDDRPGEDDGCPADVAGPAIA